MTVDSCSFSGNQANSAGGIDNYQGWLSVTASVFSGNKAISGSGSAIST